MVQRVLVIGGQGRIGRSVALDLLAHTDADITVTERRLRSAQLPESVLNRYKARISAIALDVNHAPSIRAAIAPYDLVIHCAGPFRQRNLDILAACIDQAIPYVDVSDDRDYTRHALGYREAAQAKGITAIINTGVFPGISNSMVRQAVERLDTVDQIHLSYGVGGSGGAGVTVLRTTFPLFIQAIESRKMALSVTTSF